MLTWLKKKMTRASILNRKNSQHQKGKVKYMKFHGSEENYIRNGAWVLEESIALFHGRANAVRHLSVDDLNNMNVELHPYLNVGYYELYQGSWEGRAVLVKKPRDGLDAEPFLREVAVATQIASHNHVQKLLGCCLETDLPVLIYEWMPRENLEDRIVLNNENQSKAVLKWKNRLRIAWEISHVIAYLHNAFPRPIIHRHLKPANVLLDQDNAAKLGDFSLSISIPEDEEFIEHIEVAGTAGYIAPEYYTAMKVAKSTDVYSFGMFFLVLLTGVKPSGFTLTLEGNFGLDIWARNGIKYDCVNGIVDPAIIRNGVTNIEVLQLRESMQLAIRCISKKEDCRPTMVEVATELKNMITSFEGGGVYRFFRGSKENFLQNKALILEESMSMFLRKMDPIRYFSADELNNMNVGLWHNTYNWYQGSWEGRSVLVKLAGSGLEGPLSYNMTLLRLSREIVVATLMSTHSNVHKLLGCCLETKYPALIYEWVAAETLEDRILLKDDNQNKLPVLEWKDRLRIAWEISCAVSFFHTAFPRPIIHRYLEPRSVFLNQDNTAILSNFSLSVSFPEGRNSEVDYIGRDTMDHEAPECQMYGEITEYTDVYSFGVLFFVLLTGKCSTTTDIVSWVTKKNRNKRISEIVDPVINNSEVPATELSASIELALRCTEIEEYRRPTMVDVAIELYNILRSSTTTPVVLSECPR